MSSRTKLSILSLVGGLLLLAGCGGIQGSHSVSPATFLLPGLDARQGSSIPTVVPATDVFHP